MDRLSLADALASNRLEDFVLQAEAQGIGPADKAIFDTLLRRVTAPQPEGQTSHSPGHGSKRGK